MTPGAYLKLSRKAAGLSIADVATALPTEPRLAEHLRADWIEQIEADVMPARFDTIVALRQVYRFSLPVLEALAAIALGVVVDQPPRLCRICGWDCDEPGFDDDGNDRRFPEPDLCSRCAELTSAAA